MKNFIKTAIFFLILAVLAGCKTREKQVQKSETQTETKLVTLKSQRKPTHFSRVMNLVNISYYVFVYVVTI